MIIQLSRRNFLIGSAAVLTTAALPSLPKAEQLTALLVEAQRDYAQRVIQRIWINPQDVTSGPAYAASVFMPGHDDPWLVEHLNMTGWLWCPKPFEAPMLLRDQFMKVVCDPIGAYRHAANHVPVEIGIICEDKGHDGLWRGIVETHQFPGGLRQRNFLHPEASDRPPYGVRV